jgi:hypothetical protein
VREKKADSLEAKKPEKKKRQKIKMILNELSDSTRIPSCPMIIDFRPESQATE